MRERLQIDSMPFSFDELNAWRSGDYRFLVDSEASSFLKEVLAEKAKARPGTRFFGEAFVASKLCKGNGWYSSFKWLTANKWVKQNRLDSAFEQEFACALHTAFGRERLEELQVAATNLFRHHREHLHNKKPVAPDLWLVIDGIHHFIECKLPRDVLAPHQIAGLALIAQQLGRSGKVVTRVVELRQDPEEVASTFESYSSRSSRS